MPELTIKALAFGYHTLAGYVNLMVIGGVQDSNLRPSQNFFNLTWVKDRFKDLSIAVRLLYPGRERVGCRDVGFLNFTLWFEAVV